jgi:CRP-like cAMP-binding protein
MRAWSCRSLPAQAEPGSVQAKGAGDLARLELFRGLSQVQIAQLAGQARWRAVDPGEVVIDYGDSSSDVFLVVEGRVRVLVRTPAGQEVILNDLMAGDLFGELAAISGAPRSANVSALHRSRLCVIPASVFLQSVLDAPSAALALLRVLADRIRVQSERLLELTVLPVRHRLYAELLRLSRERGSTGERVISPPPPHHIIAARIGARREAVSRELSALCRQSMVSANRRAITLLQPRLMRAAVDAKLQGSGA